MRISVKPDDPGYIGVPSDCELYKVFVNGLVFKDCFTADEEQGVAYIYKRNCVSNEILLTNSHEIVEGFVKGYVVVKKGE